MHLFISYVYLVGTMHTHTYCVADIGEGLFSTMIEVESL